MKKLIFFPGNIDCPFALNEYRYYKDYFDEIIIFSYPGEEKKYKELAEQFQFKLIIVGKKKFSFIFNWKFYSWLLRKEVKEEIKKYTGLSISGIKRFAYLAMYGMFYLECKPYFDSLSSSGNLYFYSFWLSRPAYAIALYNSQNKNKNTVKTISRAHGFDIYLYRNPLNYLPFRLFIDSNLDEIHFISDDGLQYYKKNIAAECRTGSLKRVSRLGTYISSFENRKKENKFVFVSCSNVVEVKRIDLIIDVLSNLNHDFIWYHIGDGKLLDDMKAKAEKMLKQGSFKFLGKLNNEEIIPFYKEKGINLFINMSDSEGIPVSFMEAMSCGIPVIARNVGGIKEIVTKENGLLLNPFEDLGVYTSEIFLFLNELEDSYEAYSNAAFDTWINNYNAKDIYPAFLKRLSNTTN
ncbi:MAG: glycosyltransferase [Erysipelotrichaceae bacterium]